MEASYWLARSVDDSLMRCYAWLFLFVALAILSTSNALCLLVDGRTYCDVVWMLRVGFCNFMETASAIINLLDVVSCPIIDVDSKSSFTVGLLSC